MRHYSWTLWHSNLHRWRKWGGVSLRDLEVELKLVEADWKEKQVQEARNKKERPEPNVADRSDEKGSENWPLIQQCEDHEYLWQELFQWHSRDKSLIVTAFKGELKGGENSETTFSRNPLASKIPADFIWWEKDIILFSCSSHPIVHLSCISLVQHLSSTPHHIPMAPPLSLNHQAELQLQPPVFIIHSFCESYISCLWRVSNMPGILQYLVHGGK